MTGHKEKKIKKHVRVFFRVLNPLISRHNFSSLAAGRADISHWCSRTCQASKTDVVGIEKKKALGRLLRFYLLCFEGSIGNVRLELSDP